MACRPSASRLKPTTPAIAPRPAINGRLESEGVEGVESGGMLSARLLSARAGAGGGVGTCASTVVGSHTSNMNKAATRRIGEPPGKSSASKISVT